MNAAQEYLAARVMTASPQALHLLVVDGALRHVARAEAAMESSDWDAAGGALNAARSFVGELIGGLNKEGDPAVIGNVAALFVFAFRRLVEADLDRSIEKARDAAKILRMHRETWSELLAKLTAGTPAPVSGTRAEPASSSSPTISPATTAFGGTAFGKTASTSVPAPHAGRRVPKEYDDYQPRSWSG